MKQDRKMEWKSAASLYCGECGTTNHLHHTINNTVYPSLQK